jgi:hypothetical protein
MSHFNANLLELLLQCGFVPSAQFWVYVVKANGFKEDVASNVEVE